MTKSLYIHIHWNVLNISFASKVSCNFRINYFMNLFFQKYYFTFLGVDYLRVCADGLLFDIIQNKCYREDDAQCIAGS